MPKLYKYDIEGGLMNKEQIQVEYLKLLNQKVDDENKIIIEAKKRGIWKEGLDLNNELFVELNTKFAKSIEELKAKTRSSVHGVNNKNC